MSAVQIVDYGFFRVRDTDPDEQQILYFVNDDGQDWYELRKTLTEWTPRTGKFISAIFPTWAQVDADGVVSHVDYDPSRLMPGDRRVLGIDAPIETITPGMIYRDGALLPAEEPAK